MKRAQEELDTNVGITRPMLMSDLPNLPYLQAIIKENFHLHPALPLGVPYFNSKDVPNSELQYSCKHNYVSEHLGYWS